jgi:hypothetical protein
MENDNREKCANCLLQRFLLKDPNKATAKMPVCLRSALAQRKIAAGTYPTPIERCDTGQFEDKNRVN